MAHLDAEPPGRQRHRHDAAHRMAEQDRFVLRVADRARQVGGEDAVAVGRRVGRAPVAAQIGGDPAPRPAPLHNRQHPAPHRRIAADAVQHDQHRPSAAAGVEADIDAAARQRRIPARRSGGTGISHARITQPRDRPASKPAPGSGSTSKPTPSRPGVRPGERPPIPFGPATGADSHATRQGGRRRRSGGRCRLRLSSPRKRHAARWGVPRLQTCIIGGLPMNDFTGCSAIVDLANRASRE